ncbi:MAG: cell division protein FtsW [Alphaproteobacteria bacterium]|nr:cell division protein FtsW [Alphaproteobacteria bacterium]
MMTFSRTDTSLLARWWWTVDRWTLGAIVLLLALGAVLTMAASPAVAERLNLDAFYFVRRQFVFLALGAAIMLAVSFLSPRGVTRLGAVVLAGSALLLVVVLFKGVEIKGAVRWLQVGGISLQPSEFAKPGFAVVAAWLFARRRTDERFPGFALATGLFLLLAFLLLLQPDVGQTLLIAAVWGVQFFLAGLPLVLVAAIGFLFIGISVGAYFAFSHVQARVDRFFDPSGGEGFQVARALDALRNGGLLGRGPGEGQVKRVLPDAHADFIFAVVGEEFGAITALILVGLFLFLVLRGFVRAFKDRDLFVLIAAAGLLVQFGLQAMINMASAIHLMPPKGMTLPFVSYGGSSTLGLAIGVGMMLALTRERPGEGGNAFGGRR